MADAELTVSLVARDLASRVLEQYRANLRALGTESQGATASLGSMAAAMGLGNLGSQLAHDALNAVTGAIAGVVSAGVGMNASLETSTLQFKTLMGSATEAKAHVADLFDFAKRTPFETAPVIEASRMLRVFGGDALDTSQNLTMIGDAAAATSAPIGELAEWTGRLYAAVQAGRPFGEAAQRLQELAVLTPAARNQMEQMAAGGANASQIWAVFTGNMHAFTGAMKEQATTWAGLTSTMHDTLALLAADLTQPSFEKAEQSLGRLNDRLADPRVKQGMQDIGSGAGEMTGLMGHAIEANVSFVGILDNAFRKLGDRVQEDIDLINRLKGTPGPTGEERAAQVQAVAEAQVDYNRVIGMAQQAASHYAEAKRDDTAATVANTAATDALKKAHGDMLSTFRDESDRILQVSGALNRATAGLVAYRDETARANEATQIFAKETEDALTRPLSAAQQALSAAQQARHAYSIAGGESLGLGTVADYQKDMAEEAKKAAEARKAAATDARKVEEAQAQAMAKAVKAAYTETADEAEAAYARIAAAAAPTTDGLQQQLDEATNRQVRAGIAGTAQATRELDDIRRRHLATLGDLATLDRQYAAAQDRAHAADVAVAGAERDLAVAMDRSGGVQTLATAALAHAVTARRDEALVARDAAAAIGQHRSEVLADTSALRGLTAAQNEQNKALAASLAVPGSAGGAGGFNALGQSVAHGDTAFLKDFYSRAAAATQVTPIQIHFNAPIYGVNDLDQHINNAIRSGNIRVTGR